MKQIYTVFILFTFICCYTFQSFSQENEEDRIKRKSIDSLNLIMNGDFEDFESCPEGYTQWSESKSVNRLIPGWFYPTQGTPDYFNRCSKNDQSSVPENNMGICEPRSGNGYSGFFLKSSEKVNYAGYREYLSSRLTEPLKKGQKYCVSLYYMLSSYSTFAVDNLGVYFSGSRYQSKTFDVLTFPAQIQNPKGKFMTNKKVWKELTGVYTANGDEEYIFIGNFFEGTAPFIKADTTVVPKRIIYRYSFYFIDDVSIKELHNCKDCNEIPHDLNVKVEEAKFSEKDNKGKISLDISGGTVPYEILWSNGATTESISNLTDGTYSYTVKDFYNCIIKDSIVFSGPLKVLAESGCLGANSGYINLTIRGGVPKYSVSWNNGAIGPNLKDLPIGTYSYTVTDQTNNTITGSITFDEFSCQLSTIKEGGSIVLENIFFDFDKTDLLPKSFIELDKVIDFMQSNDISLVEISGHTDSKGSDEYNQKLSEGRAKSVADYLIFKGIEKERLAYVGYGEVQPIATNDTDEGRAKNRRVEFKLIKK